MLRGQKFCRYAPTRDINFDMRYAGRQIRAG